jgi:hypothetical protein
MRGHNFIIDPKAEEEFLRHAAAVNPIEEAAAHRERDGGDDAGHWTENEMTHNCFWRVWCKLAELERRIECPDPEAFASVAVHSDSAASMKFSWLLAKLRELEQRIVELEPPQPVTAEMVAEIRRGLIGQLEGEAP